MNAVSLFSLIGALYLAIVAYGVVRTRKKGLPDRTRLAAAAAQVVLPPVLMLVALLMEGDPRAIGGWGLLLGMLMVAGTLLAICTDMVARRVL